METKPAIIRYCRYQERCHSEVRNKLYEIGCYTAEVEQLLTELIEMGLLNEERFARAFARGKFRMLQWGRVKIKQELTARKISEYCIRQGMKEIDEEGYAATMQKLVDRKWRELRTERSPATKKGKLYRYMVQKGYENSIILELLQEKINEGK
ncbi:MAG: RecX family transcriptional regulator [Taibaiella sp.]|nr:RecX family transcriptional regulator [Taibaiella sp.]